MKDLINNRYQIVRPLGKGGMGTVYLVEDTLRDRQTMALKTIRSDLLGERNLAQFKYEFAALGQLHHPNLVTVYDFGAIADGTDHFFTMEYVLGDDLPALLAQRGQPLTDYAWLYEMVVQVCRALQYIHSRGLIHYDVKPRNIRVTPDGQVRLMDFGLIGEARGEGQIKVRGTPEYIAPEVIRGDPVDHRADLYSLGVSLYEILTGCLPFADTSSILVLRQHVEAVPDLPLQFAESVPPGLQVLIRRLMDKEPVNRYNSANAVIQAINDISGLNFPSETKETKRGYIQSGKFVGREFELARLQGLLVRMMQGHGRLVLIAGAAGMGKARLVRELRLRAQMQRALVCEGACSQEVRSPYYPWLSVFRQVISHQQATNPALLETYGAALSKMLPELADQINALIPSDAPASPSVPSLPGEGKLALMDAALRFLLACDLPLVLILEDAQYADAETIELLDYLGQRASMGRLLLCCVYRDEDVDETHPLNRLTRQARLISRRRETPTSHSLEMMPYDLLRIGPLTEQDTADLLGSMLGVKDLPEGLLPRVMAEAGGNPLFIESIMYSLVEEDLLQYDGQTWRIDVENLKRIPASIQEVAQRRLERLPADSLELMQWAAVMGYWLDLDILAQVSGWPPDQVFGHVAAAVQRHVLAAGDKAGEQVYRFSNDRMREAVYDTLLLEQRVERHLRIGEALRQLYPESEIAESLAWHFEQAGEASQALRYLKLAADKARQVYANETAIRHYGRALALLAERVDLADAQLEYDLLAGREACHQLVGNRRAQQDDLARMADLARDMGNVTRQIEVVTRRVTLSNELGDFADAQSAAESALDLAHQVGNLKLQADMLSSLGQACYPVGEYARAQAYHEQALALYRQLGERRGEVANLRLLGRVYNRLGETAQANQAYKQSLELARVIGDRPSEASALNSLGIAAIDQAEARRYHEQALAIRQAVGDRSGQAMSYNNLAMAYWGLGLYGKARDYLEQAIYIQREMHGRTSLAAYLETLGRVHLEMGDYVQAQQALEEGRSIAGDIGDRFSIGVYLLMLGRVALARQQLAQARDLIQSACDVLRELKATGYIGTALAWLSAVSLAKGDWPAAERHSQAAVELVDEAGNAGDYPPQDVWWLRYQALKMRPDAIGGEEAARLDEAAWQALQRARQIMLEGIATLSDEGLRRNYLNRIKINRDIVTEWTRQAAKRGEEEALAAEEAARPGLEMTVAEADRVRDQLQRVLGISLQMNETHDAESLLSYVMDQVTELSGAERGFLVLMDQEGHMAFKVTRGMAEDEIERAQAQISYTVLGMVTQSRQPVLLQDAMTDERFGQQSSVLELNLRSVLCVPLLARAELVGLIYADNRSVSGRFSQADVNLLTIFANQAATAIENANLYQETLRAKQELEAWAHTLEQRVAERTAALQQANAALSQRAVQLETSSQVGRQVTSILDLDKLLLQVVNLIQESFAYYFVSVWLVAEGRDWVALQAGSGQVGQTLVGQAPRIPLDAASIVALVCKEGDSRLVEDVSTSPDYMVLEALPNTCSELALPLRMGQLIIGALDIQSDHLNAFSHDDQMVLQTLADQIAIAIRNAQFYRAERTRRRLAEALERTGRELSSVLDMRQVPARVLEQLALVVPYERGAVFLQRDNSLQTVAQRGFPEDDQSHMLSIPIRAGDVFEQVVDRRQAVLVDDVTREPGWQQVGWLPVNCSWMGVPLIAQDRVTGMISLTRQSVGAFGHEDAALVSAFAAQAAVALENARLYDEITRFNEHLEQMVQQRTEELENAYQTLEQLDRTKSSFIEVAAHELRTPLTVIRGYTQVLESRPSNADDPEGGTLLTGILSGVDRLHEIVNSMLDVTKLDSQSLHMRKERTVLLSIIEQVRHSFRQALQDRRLTLTLVGLDSLPLIRADSSLLYKVFYQLIVNAIKYTPDGGSITVTGRVVEGETPPTVEIVVSDTGIGIDPSHHSLIFEKFYQTGEVAVHSSGKTKFKGGGPGLGLAIARGIVLAHGGRIWVESTGCDEEHCPGSRFYVRLPLGE